ncbi:MAG: gamma-glutamyltransferase [Candidatus Tectomicrobia bacterium]|nr:gamma-glutamyltransferase [Candidatus Tectomicrobia bacterium]
MVQVVRGRSGMVVSGHHLASFEAASILRQGGNAVDAAVAAGAVLAVVCPDACGLGGDLFMLIYDAAAKTLHGLNGSGRSPAAADRHAFAAGIPTTGIRAVSVPGMVAAWEAALERFGTRGLADLLQPAISYAAEGFPVYPNLARNVGLVAAHLEQDLGAKATFLPQGRPPQAGEVLPQRDLAATLQLLGSEGSAAFYRGAIAERLVAASREQGGLLSLEDLAEHSCLWQEPLKVDFYGCTVATMPPNSYGVTLLLQLAELEADGIAGYEAGSVEMLRRGMQARVHAYLEALGVIADPAAVENEARALLEKKIAALRVQGRRGDGMPRQGRAPAGSGGSDTSNVVVMDQFGNAVSLIQSVFHFFGSCVAPRGAGVVLNNRMLGFHLDLGHPNCVAPRRRPAHTLTPVMVLRDGVPCIACGTPGGPGQTATLAQFLTRVLACGQDAGEAIAAPRWSVTLDGRFVLEDMMEGAVLSELHRHAHGPLVAPAGSQPFGSLMAVVDDGVALLGAADRRRDAAACGW